ncbi:single-stranded DNA-binding protein WHY2, mitochondrial [Humulus lupulus]|uniref:single-stranded DNA-binding protein WHY2, mitochondrial n=1 Tax=Humulus lupulus TaxID=3486 RepID=UPI002B402C11|nr:single-stranded DNA-binding protein WHY2, mitochondrial [Humulus lupulus]
MMMKLSRLLLSSRNQISRNIINGKDGNPRNGLPSFTFTSRAGISTSGQNINIKGFAAPYTVYKGKAALSVNPILPTFTKLDSGIHVVERRGCMMLKFTPAIGERKYDWEKRQMFALSPTEVGSLISLGPNDSCEFFHDPSMLSSNAGQVRKSLTIRPHSNGGGYMISLTVVNNILKSKDNISVPFTTAEFIVVKTACSYALPHILGWDRMTDKVAKDIPGRRTADIKFDRPQFLDSEWDK